MVAGAPLPVLPKVLVSQVPRAQPRRAHLPEERTAEGHVATPAEVAHPGMPTDLLE
jgi:hypothetical protein